MDGRLSFIFCLLSLAGHITSSQVKLTLKLECNVDYHGHIIFRIKIPSQYQENGGKKPVLFYRKYDSTTWNQKRDCMTVTKKKVLQCDMYELVKKERYNLKLSISSNGTQFNISQVLLNKKLINWSWNTTAQYSLCKNGVGTKFMALQASYDNITLDWIKQPLDSTMGRAVISVNSKERNESFDVTYTSCHLNNGTCKCKKDLCEYHLKNLKSCTKYKICINTRESLAHDLKCKNIETYCDFSNSSPALRWQDILLTIFGIIILFVCCLLVWGIIMRYKTHRVVDDNDDELCPRNNSHRCEEELCLNISDAPSIYHYPDSLNNKLQDGEVES